MSNQSERTAVWLKITPQTPLLLTGKTAVSNFQQSQTFISGGTLRGAIGTKLIQQSESRFEALFAGEEPYFGNAYYGGGCPIWPFPLTAWTCKRFPGFSQGQDNDHHGVVDLLAADFAYDVVSDPLLFVGETQMSRQELQPNIGDWLTIERKGSSAELSECSVCGKPRQPASGTYFAGSQTYFNNEPVPVARKTQVAINRARAVAQDSLLYTQERLDVVNQEAFYAYVTIPEDRVDVLAEAIEGVFYIGRGRSKGNGRIVIEIIAAPELPSLSDRLLDFNGHLQDAFLPYAKAYPEKVTAKMPGTFFSLTLRTQAIFQHAGRPLRAPSSMMLNLPQAAHIYPVRTWARMENVGGWDSAARLPRRRELG
ncbi:MAG: hypothetical protein KC434_12390, partial [Anaerolineales bacterium]|nr:hypothetical protein [Anaerolineales bacterium]